MRNLLRRTIVLPIVLAALVIPTLALAGQTWDEMAVWPDDTIDAENVRVWLAQERKSFCRLEVVIYDSVGQAVRHLLNEVIRPGYFNLYWNKQDDSGNYVPGGRYVYGVNDCGGNRRGRLRVAYKKGENAARLKLENYLETNWIEFDLLADSSVVTLQICNQQSKPIATPIEDSVMVSGHHVVEWIPTSRNRRRVYFVKLYVDEFIHKGELTVKP